MSIARAERQLILMSAGTAARRLAMHERAGPLAREADWSRLADALRARNLLGVLGPRLIELGGDSTSKKFAAAVEQGIETGRRRGIVLQLVALRIVGMLADEGIRSAVLKGPLLGEAIYGDPGRRISSDIDLLVSPRQLGAAVEVVRGLGYLAPSDHVYDCRLPLIHFTLAHEQGELPPVELHWRIHWYEREFACERLLPPWGVSVTDWRPAAADELVALLLFYARDGFVDLRLACDVSAWWDLRSAELRAGAIDELLSVYPAFARVIAASAKAAERVVGLPAREVIAGCGKLAARQRAAARLANPNPHASRSQLYADMGFIDGLLAPAGGLGAFVRRQLLPPREVLEEQALHSQRRRARSRFARCVGVLGRYGLTMIRLVRGSERLP
jgi:hypothetical protein